MNTLHKDSVAGVDYTLTGVSRDLASSPSSWYRQEHALTNGDFSYKGKRLLRRGTGAGEGETQTRTASHTTWN